MSEMTVGCIRTTVMPQQSGIYEALLEKAERDNAELADRLSGLELSTTQKLAQLEQERDEARALLERKWDKEDPPLVRMMRERDEAREESLEQARLLGKGGSREARLITERDHYKTSLESLLKSIDDWNDSMVKEPADDFIAAIAAYITEKLEK